MPCRYDPSPAEIAASHADATRRQDAKERKLKKDLDRLTHEGDMLREAIIALVDEGTPPSPDVMELIAEKQIEHRKEDLKRLEKTFREKKDAERLGKTMLADPQFPLEPQLGFDPDAF